jgi:uncharacterized FAD-dependent dehydrogenase
MYKDKYDVAIIGAGFGGLFAAYKLKRLNNKLKILIIDKGNELDKRICPAATGNPCTHCRTCAITSGITGSGAFSDAKFNIGTAYGGTLAEELGEDVAMDYISRVDNILKYFSDDYPEIFESNEDLKLRLEGQEL